MWTLGIKVVREITSTNHMKKVASRQILFCLSLTIPTNTSTQILGNALKRASRFFNSLSLTLLCLSENQQNQKRRGQQASNGKTNRIDGVFLQARYT